MTRTHVEFSNFPIIAETESCNKQKRLMLWSIAFVSG